MSDHPPWHAFDWAMLLALIVVVLAYLGGTRRRRSAAQVVAFLTGWLVLATILLPVLHAHAATRFWIHMVALELLTLVVPPLLLFALPSKTGHQRIASSIPPLATLLFAIVLWAWHIPLLYEQGLATPVVRALQHASLFASAFWLWNSVLRRASGGTGVLCIAATMIHMGLLGALLTLAPAPLYAGHTLQDQQLGGLIMWVPAGFAVLLKGLWTFDRWLESQS